MIKISFSMSSDANGHNNSIFFLFVVVEIGKSQILQLQII